MNKLWKNLIICFLLTTVCEAIPQRESFDNGGGRRGGGGGTGCGKYEWKCKNGDCIDSEQKCDGKKDCRDGSDETAEACVHLRCPSYAFRCAYGACVSGKSECDGIEDCADKSDETSASCPGVSYKLKGNCSSDDEFQCTSGECILIEYACDGTPHCKDASDETVKLCASKYCPTFAFRCGYGACISGSGKCDGIRDCHDGSDESQALCGRDHKVDSSGSSFDTSTGDTSIGSQSGCRVADIPNLVFVYASSPNERIKPGEYVGEYISVLYKCRPKHLLIGSQTNFCEGGGVWVKKHPTCRIYCSSLGIIGVTIQTSCELNGKGVPCDQPSLPGTIAKISCQIGYMRPSADRFHREELVCNDDGSWSGHPFRCEQICGTEPVQGQTYVLGGEKVNNTQVPWHVAIYSKIRTGNYEQICAGTIINPQLVLSAAHCFWDNSPRQRLFDKSLFAVGVGKYYRDFYAAEPLATQFFNISELHVDSYQDIHLYYLNDIAILVLNNVIIFNHYIRPICIEWQNYSEYRVVQGNIIGKVAGWGKLENNEPSNELRVVNLPTVSDKECSDKTDPEYRTFITGDKFCVGTQNQQTVCEGDSGGGFAVPKIIDGIKTYYLYGIVSNGLRQGQCSSNFLTVFTNIQYHKDMILTYLSKYNPK